MYYVYAAAGGVGLPPSAGCYGIDIDGDDVYDAGRSLLSRRERSLLRRFPRIEDDEPAHRSTFGSHVGMRRRSTSTRTSGNETGCARSSRSRRSTDTPSNSIDSTWKASWPSQNVFYRGRRTCGSINQKQRLKQLFVPHGIAFDGKKFVQTAVATHTFNYLTCADDAENEVAPSMRFEPRCQPNCSTRSWTESTAN